MSAFYTVCRPASANPSGGRSRRPLPQHPGKHGDRATLAVRAAEAGAPAGVRRAGRCSLRKGAMPDRATRLAEALAGGLCAFGAALVTAPNTVLTRAGLPCLNGAGLLFARLTGVRDLAFGAALLGARGALARRRLLRIVAAVSFADALLLLLGRGRLPAGRAALGAAASAATGALALDLAAGVRERRSRPFAAFEVGAALLGVGWLRRGSRAGGAINLCAALAGLLWWL